MRPFHGTPFEPQRAGDEANPAERTERVTHPLRKRSEEPNRPCLLFGGESVATVVVFFSNVGIRAQQSHVGRSRARAQAVDKRIKTSIERFLLQVHLHCFFHFVC